MMSLLYTRDLLSLCPSTILMTLILILRNSYADEAAILFLGFTPEKDIQIEHILQIIFVLIFSFLLI